MKEKLLVPGEHNRQNAKTALAVASILKINLVLARSALSGFRGTWRRFEYKGKTKSDALVYDDYAHNPQKVRAALQGARELYPDKKIIVVFQPHLFSRTKLLLNEFATAFSDADEIILAPIFPAREPFDATILAPIFPAREVFDPTISSEILAEKIRTTPKSEFDPSLEKAGKGESPVHAFPDFASIISYLESSLGPSDLLITMGAGEQYKIGEALLK